MLTSFSLPPFNYIIINFITFSLFYIFLIKKFIKKNFNVKVYSCKTVRDKYKVALSSRNSLLNKKDLKKSSYIANLLLRYRNNLQKKISLKKKIKIIKDKINNMDKIKIEYLEIRNKNNLSKNFNKKNFKIFLAYYNKNIRLIDNF